MKEEIKEWLLKRLAKKLKLLVNGPVSYIYRVDENEVMVVSFYKIPANVDPERIIGILSRRNDLPE